MRRSGFSMVELVIVVVIAGIIAAIAVPRVTGFAARSRTQRVVADQNTLQKSAEMFAAEHSGLILGRLSGGGKVDADVLNARLTSTTDDTGDIDGTGIFGPYLRTVPENVLNGLATVRIDGAGAGAGTHGWRYDTTTNAFHSDVAYEATLPDGSTVDHEGTVRNVQGIVVNLAPL